MPSPIRALDGGDRTAGGPLRTGIPQGEQLLVGHISTDLPEAVFDPLLDLGQVLIDQLRTGHRLIELAAGSPSFDIVLDGVVGAAGQLAGITQRPGQVVGIQDFHDLLGRLQLIPSSGAVATSSTAHRTRGRGLNRGPRQGRRRRVGQIP